MPDIFISLRFDEALAQGNLLKDALVAHGLDVFLCAVAVGNNIADSIAENIVQARLVVILGTATYGMQTSSSYSTHAELKFIMAERKPFFLIKMCDEFQTVLARFYINTTVAYYPWDAKQNATLPQGLVEQIIARYQTIIKNTNGAPLAPTSMPSTASLTSATVPETIMAEAGVLSVACNNNGLRACGLQNNSIKVLTSGFTDKTVLKRHSDWVTCVCFHPTDESVIASCSRDGSINLWDCTNGSFLHSLEETQVNSSSVNSICFNSSGSMLASGFSDAKIKLWNLADNSLERTLSDHTLSVTSVCFNPNPTYSSILASGSCDNTIKYWNIDEGEVLKTLEGHIMSVLSVCFNAQGTRLASGSRDMTIKVWDYPSGSLLRTLSGHSAPVTTVCFHPSRSILASGSHDKTIKCWDVSNWTILTTSEEHSDWVKSVCFETHATGSVMILTGSLDKTIKSSRLHS